MFQDGWRDVGFTGPDCVKFGPPRPAARQVEGNDSGWRDAGFTAPDCTRFALA